MTDDAAGASQQDGAGTKVDPAHAQAARAAALGAVLAVIMASTRHARMTIEEFATHVAPAVERGQFSVVALNRKDDGGLAGVAACWWALISSDVEKRLTESRERIVKLSADEWRSGPQPWIIDAVGEPAAVNALLAQLVTRNFTNPPAKMRSVMPDGRIVVGKLEARPARTDGTPSEAGPPGKPASGR